MASLRDQLNKILPEILPATPETAISGTDLIGLIIKQGKIDGKFSEGSLRNHFTVMSGDPTSPIAKVDQGRGYYLRSFTPKADNISNSSESNESENIQNITAIQEEEKAKSRANQLEEKFRSLFIRWAELSNQFPMHIEHTKAARQESGINKWKFPDVVIVKWEVGEITDKGFKLEKNMLEVKQSLGEQPFRLTSIELKVDIEPKDIRAYFFQCVSNSKWAHSAQLVVATSISDEKVAEELRRLGASYDISVISFGLKRETLENLPDSQKILEMSDKEIEEIMPPPRKIASGRDRDSMDWEHLRDLKAQSPDINNLFAWIAYCLTQKKPYSVKDWLKIAEIEQKMQHT